MTSVNSWYPEPVEMDGPGLEWGPVQWANEGTFSDAEHLTADEHERRFYTIAIRRGWSENSDVASIAVLGVTRDLESGVETRYRADSENWTPVDRDGIPPSVCKRPPRDSNIPLARKDKFRSVLKRAHDLESDPVEARTESASELRADGGTRESEQVDRAVREAATLIDAGDSKRVAISYVVDEYDLEHRRDDVHQRVRDRLEHKLVADGGQCSSGTYRAGVSESDFEQMVNSDSISIVDHSRTGPTSGFSRFVSFTVNSGTEPITDGGHNPEDLVVLECEPCDYQTVVARGTISMTSCPDCQGDLEIDTGRVAHKCAQATDINHVIVESGERCPLCQTTQRAIVADGGRDAFLSGDAHWCDLCDRPFSTLGELIHHDCQDQQLVADGGRPEHRATCDDCSWSYRDTDLVDVSDEMDRHARKEMHDVDLERAVATDGGATVGGGGREVPDSMRCDECGKILYTDEEWRLKPEYVPGTMSEDGNEYIHERCFPPESGHSDSNSENSTGTEGGDRR